MSQVQKIDILVGIKADQSLRDVLRQASEDRQTELELVPVGKKDWIAGKRLGSELGERVLLSACKKVHRELLDLGSDQRIRFENIKLFAVQKPVPVFKEIEQESDRDIQATPEPKTSPLPSEDESPSEDGDSFFCPVCQRKVHRYNLHYNTDGDIVGCFMCGGNRVDF